MEIEQLRKEINQVLANISEHSERFTGKDYLPALEVSVLLSKINKLQELAAILKYEIQQKEELRRLNTRNENKVIVAETINETFVAPENPSTESATEPQAVVDEMIEDSIVEEVTVAPVEEKIVESPKTEVKPTENKPTSVSDKFLHTPIANLKDAFSLNDRYLFANELFKKDMALFNETVKSIDSCNSLIEAQEILQQSQIKFSWDAENERVINFYQLVERRFI